MRASLPPDRSFDVAGTGFTVLDRLYADGSLTDESLGGSCGNVLVSLAMLNRQVAPVLALGEDDEGERLICEFLQAGAEVRYIRLHANTRSPVLAQQLDTTSGHHNFSFVCPETRVDLPRYQPIGDAELASASSMLTRCSVFYTDRLSESIVQAMRTAWEGGATVFFEPSDVSDQRLFNEAIGMASILKYSVDRLGEELADLRHRCVRIVTHGATGLEIGDGEETVWCDAFKAPVVLDTCGSGDMVSVGVIDWMLSNKLRRERLTPADLVRGVVAGQRLAAANCGFAGARGLFRSLGAPHVRQILRYSAATG